tara:strand:- start:11 stop:655 length:645 start_codon:yes stop_codon:yes gene_type:complete
MASTSGRTTLKSHFDTGDKPTASNFVDFIDSTVNVTDDTVITGAVSLNTTARMTAGTGISSVAAAIYKTSVVTIGSIIYTDIMIDLTGLNSGQAVNDIIGKAATANCHIGQITAAVNGTIFGGKMTCLEVPAGGDPNVVLWYASEGTGVEDTLITALTQVQLTVAGDQTIGEVSAFIDTVIPTANKYLYLACGAATDATYTSGKFLIQLVGYAA